MQHLKERKQFGVLIGSFQALQHRAALQWTEIELCRSVVLKALRCLDDSEEESGYWASVAKAKLCEVAELVTNEAIQMHGGVGMTDEHEIGFFIKRSRSVQALFGGYGYHAERVAQFGGY